MAKAIFLAVLKILIVLIFTGWVCVWFLMPTGLWRKSWHTAEDSARKTIFGYSGTKIFSLGVCLGEKEMVEKNVCSSYICTIDSFHRLPLIMSLSTRGKGGENCVHTVFSTWYVPFLFAWKQALYFALLVMILI